VFERYISSRGKSKRTEAKWVEEGEIITKLDCRGEVEKIKPTEDLEEICIDPADSTKVIKVGKELEENLKADLI